MSALALRIEDALDESTMCDGDKAARWIESARRDLAALRSLIAEGA